MKFIGIIFLLIISHFNLHAQYHLNEIQLPTIDYKAKLEEKYGVTLPQKQINQDVQQENLMSNSFLMKKLNELENRMQDMAMDVAERIAQKIVAEQAGEIAKEVAKDTVGKIIVEFAKSGKQILIETSKVKKAEIVAKDKVKIDGKVYKLTEVKV